MAICELCKREMLEGGTCAPSMLRFQPKGRPDTAGVDFDKVRFGREQRFGIVDDSVANCHDCGIEHGALHHPGCDWEECPRCHGQLLGCACNDEGTFADVLTT